MTLTLVRGVPGSGKSTWAKKNLSCCILENDQMQTYDGEYHWTPEGIKRAVSLVSRIADEILTSGADVCVCNTFTKKRFVEGFRKMAEKHGASFKVVRLNGNFKNVHDVPAATLKSMKDSFEDWPGEEVVDPAIEEES